MELSDEWCNCQAIEGTANYPGPWHPFGDATCEHATEERSEGCGCDYPTQIHRSGSGHAPCCPVNDAWWTELRSKSNQGI